MDLSTLIQNRIAATTGLRKKSDTRYLDTDLLYQDLANLVNDRFKLWYYHVFHKLGRERVLTLASQARADGKDARKLFSHLLRKELHR